MQLFAYASNMDVVEFGKTVPSAKKIANVKLTGYKFGFSLTADDGSTKASLVPSDDINAFAWGVLVEFNDDELDNFFFQDEWFEWTTVNCTDEAGEIYQAKAFVTQPHAINEFTLPYDWYHAKILKIATEQGFPDNYLTTIKLMPCKTDPDTKRSARRFAKLNQ